MEGEKVGAESCPSSRETQTSEEEPASKSSVAKGSVMAEEAGGCPVMVQELPPGEVARLVTLGFKGYTGLVRTHPGGVLMRARYKEMAHHLYNFEFRSDDIVVMTYPKCGTTWMLEIVWAMTHLNELHEAERFPITHRTFFIDSDALYLLEDQMKDRFLTNRFFTLCPDGRPEQGIIMQSCHAHAAGSGQPRIIKTHFPLALFRPGLLDTCKVIYVCRNPKDACVSYHHHCRLIKTYQFEGQFEDFAQAFREGDVFYGNFWDNVAPAWQQRQHHNLHFVFYEDLQVDGLSQLKKLARFLNLTLSEEQLKKVASHASFPQMKSRDALAPITLSSSTDGALGGFFRKGVMGDWRNVASPELDEVMDDWIAKNNRQLRIPFKYTLD